MGIDELLDVIVSAENSEENAYNSHVILTYPVGLSYRKLTSLQVRCQDLFQFIHGQLLFRFIQEFCWMCALFYVFVFNKGKN